MEEAEFQKEMNQRLTFKKSDLLDVICTIVFSREGIELNTKELDIARGEIYHQFNTVLGFLNDEKNQLNC